jgi:hypothetical protein
VRGAVDRSKLQRVLAALGSRARGPGRVYVTGGGTALLLGWRESTVDVDLRLDPEPDGIFEAIREIKDVLDANVELASPADFLPELPGWRERSRFIARHGEVDFFHFDLYSQALSKIERGHAQDVRDVRSMMALGLVEPNELRRLYQAIEPELIRFPALDADALRAKVEALLGAADEEGDA